MSQAMKTISDDALVTYGMLRRELKASENRIYKAMSDEFLEISKRMLTKDSLKGFATKDDLKRFATKDDLKGFATKDDINEIKGLLVDALKKSNDLQDENAVMTHQYQRHDDTLQNHEKRLSRVETNLSLPSPSS